VILNEVSRAYHVKGQTQSIYMTTEFLTAIIMRLCRPMSYGRWRRVVSWISTNVSENAATSIFREGES